jgi:hypothetical protein
MPDKSPLELLAEELGAVAGQIEREASLRIDAVVADLRRGEAERELRMSNLERAVTERLASIKDGEPGAPGASVAIEQIATLVDGVVAAAVAALPKAADGASVTLDDVSPMIFAEVARAVATLPPAEKGEPGAPGPPGEPGISVTPADLAPMVEAEVSRAMAALPPAERGAKGEPGEPGKDGDPGPAVTVEDVAPLIAAEVDRAVSALPPAEKGAKGDPGAPGRIEIARQWSDKVHYEGAVVTHAGATWQAVKDTGREPPHDDWVCLAAAGRNGLDGRTPRVRDTFDAAVTDYRELDIVALSGAAFIARHDAPGVCPGAGWKMIAMQGKTGKPGERGGVGPRGPAGPGLQRIAIDGEGMLSALNADGSTVECDLYPVLSKLDR